MTKNNPGERSTSMPATNDGGGAKDDHLAAPDTKANNRVGGAFMWLLALAVFGNYVALVAPIAYSLAVRIASLVPDNQAVLGYVTGIGALFGVVLAPVFGTLSDRTRSRLGRRRPWILAGAVVGLAGLAISALAPSFGMLMLGWCVSQLGLGTAQLQITNTIADRVPEFQRGRVSGVVGVAQMLGSVIGAGIAAAFVSNALLLFLVPGVVGTVLMLLFVLVIRDTDSRNMNFGPAVSAGALIKSYVYDVRKYVDFSWNWLGRFVFQFALTLATTFSTLFFALKLGAGVAQIGALIALSALLGVVATAGSAALSGYLSDRLNRRRIFVFIAGFLFAAGVVLLIIAPSLPLLLIGSFVMNFGLGVFLSVDQAIYLSVLPERETQAGRFVGINQFSALLPQVIAPLVAPTVLLIGGTTAQGNFPLLFGIAALFGVVGGIIILTKVKAVR